MQTPESYRLMHKSISYIYGVYMLLSSPEKGRHFVSWLINLVSRRNWSNRKRNGLLKNTSHCSIQEPQLQSCNQESITLTIKSCAFTYNYILKCKNKG